MKKTAKTKRKVTNSFPRGWDEARVQKLVARYENQSGDEAAAEDEATFAHARTSMIEVPDRLVPAVRELLAKSG